MSKEQEINDDTDIIIDDDLTDIESTDLSLEIPDPSQKISARRKIELLLEEKRLSREMKFFDFDEDFE